MQKPKFWGYVYLTGGTILLTNYIVTDYYRKYTSISQTQFYLLKIWILWHIITSQNRCSTIRYFESTGITQDTACARTLSHQHLNRIADKGRFLVDAFIMRGPKINDHLQACLRHRMPVKRTLLSDALIDITWPTRETTD